MKQSDTVWCSNNEEKAVMPAYTSPGQDLGLSTFHHNQGLQSFLRKYWKLPATTEVMREGHHHQQLGRL